MIIIAIMSEVSGSWMFFSGIVFVFSPVTTAPEESPLTVTYPVSTQSIPSI